MSEQYDALVVGGGLGGAALGVELARAGRRVILFEREAVAHDKVCGEFISHEGARYLERLGVGLGAMGSVEIGHVRLVHHGRTVTSPLPFRAQSLSRRVLDEALLAIAARAGVEVCRGSRVKTLVRGREGWTVSLDGGGEARGSDAFLATGKHDLPGWKRPAGAQPDLIGLKSYWRLAPHQIAALQGHVELILFPGGYAGLQPVEDGLANLCLLVKKSAFANLYKTYDGLLAAMISGSPHLAMRLRDSAPLLTKPLAITGLPYGYVVTNAGLDGPWRLGDQAAVIPSFSGDGMSISLHSAQLAANFYLKGRTSAAYHKQIRSDVSAQVARATFISKMLVTGFGQRVAMGGARLIPAILTRSAALTRIPERALQAIDAPP